MIYLEQNLAAEPNDCRDHSHEVTIVRVGSATDPRPRNIFLVQDTFHVFLCNACSPKIIVTDIKARSTKLSESVTVIWGPRGVKGYQFNNETATKLLLVHVCYS